MQGVAITILAAIGLASVGWGVSIILAEQSPLLPWIGLLLIVLGGALVVVAVAWCSILLLDSKKRKKRAVILTNRDELLHAIEDFRQWSCAKFDAEYTRNRFDTYDPHHVHVEEMVEEEKAQNPIRKPRII
jgi:hypothetical protein